MAKEDADEKAIDAMKPVMRIVNHIDGIKYIGTKTGMLSSLKNYYGHLKDKIL